LKSKLISVTLCIIIILLLSATCFADQGVVVAEHSGRCAIEYIGGYLLVEWFGGYSPSKSDIYTGENFNQFGMRDLYCVTSGTETKFWVEDFMASKDKARKYVYRE